MAQNKLISIGGLQHFLEKLKSETFAPMEHKHQATDIIENAEKKFVSDTQIARWNDTYTKGETDQKLGDLVKGLDWKESVDNYDAISTTYPEPEEGWTVSVKDTNHIYRYDADTQKWVDIGQSADIPLATAKNNGLLSKEDFVQLQNLQSNLDSKLGKEENAISASKLETARNINGVAFDGTQDITINSDSVPQGTTNLYCTSEEKTNWADKYTKTEVDGKVDTLNGTITSTKEELTQTITEATTPATDEEIDALFV